MKEMREKYIRVVLNYVLELLTEHYIVPVEERITKVIIRIRTSTTTTIMIVILLFLQNIFLDIFREVAWKVVACIKILQVIYM